MKIKSATFVKSSTKADQCPGGDLPEYAFIGRSNVGKSSLINMLTERKHLAKTSGRPGKTQLINHFLINDTWYLVDLPGYGYARASKKDKAAFQGLIRHYFANRRQLLCAFVLLDLRHEPQSVDLDFMAWLNGAGIPFCMVFTKADKLKQGAQERQAGQYLEQMREAGWVETPPHFITSSAHGVGKEEVLTYIEGVNQAFRESQKNNP
ncbi:ribosome biogenesis GTP-binding protein YihA/YsxC [Robiginitalea sediminis]|uniref:ribosome biogenesis GTP-binding protein YihA/YsxC n=1 Tax=Robiginitalea sediminis TaxID=1982593 RepID=UPI000B4AD169|nr:ribosome biogenesis GTP-binding protein YihA/YsxC [Robiginitalea sediminis]